MKLVIYEGKNVHNFLPIAYLRPTFDLRCGHGYLYEKIIRQHSGLDVAFYCRDYLTDTFAQLAPEGSTVNDMSALDDDLLIVNGCLLIGDEKLNGDGPDGICVDGDGDIVCARVKKETAVSLKAENFLDFLDQLVEKLPKKTVDMELAKYQWDVVLKNGKVIDSDFEISGRSGIEGSLHEDSSVYGPEDRLYIAKGAEIHPQVVIDTNHGSVTIEEGAIVFPHSRIEGPCYIGKDTQITRGNIREGCSFGPVCRVGGEVEEAVIHAYSNKYHDGFLGHAYVCEWVNLGALTTNSDLKNDYGSVEVYMQRDDGTFSYVDSGSTKVGSFIGDHTKTSIGVFLNTGFQRGSDDLADVYRRCAAETYPLVCLVPRGSHHRWIRLQEA